MKKQLVKFRPVLVLLLAGWCLLFFRCETTEKSMARAVYLAQTEGGVTAALWVQAPQAAADASEASAALQMTCTKGETLEKALYSAQKQLGIRNACSGTRLRADSGAACLHGTGRRSSHPA